MHAVVHAGLVEFQKKSGARDGGWLKRRNDRARHAMLPESDLNIACGGGETNFRRYGRGLKAFTYLEVAIFSSSVTDYAKGHQM